MAAPGTFLHLTHDLTDVQRGGRVSFWAREKLHEKLRRMLAKARSGRVLSPGQAAIRSMGSPTSLTCTVALVVVDLQPSNSDSCPKRRTSLQFSMRCLRCTQPEKSILSLVPILVSWPRQMQLWRPPSRALEASCVGFLQRPSPRTFGLCFRDARHLVPAMVARRC